MKKELRASLVLAAVLTGCQSFPVTEIEGAAWTQLNPYFREDKNILASLKVRAYLCRKDPVRAQLKPFLDYFHLSSPATSHERHFVGDLIGGGMQLKSGECR